MTWLLVALVTYAGSTTPDLKIHGWIISLKVFKNAIDIVLHTKKNSLKN